MGYPTWVPVPLLPKFSSSSDASLGVEGEHGLPAPAPSRMMLRGKLRRAQLPQGTYPPTSPPPLTTGQGFRPSEPYEKGVFGHSAGGRDCASNSLVGVTGGPALRAGTGRRYQWTGTSGQIASGTLVVSGLELQDD